MARVNTNQGKKQAPILFGRLLSGKESPYKYIPKRLIPSRELPINYEKRAEELARIQSIEALYAEVQRRPDVRAKKEAAFRKASGGHDRRTGG